MSHLGDFFYDSTVPFTFNTRGTDGALATASGLTVAVLRRDLWPWMGRGSDVENTAGITIVADVDGMTGVNSVQVDMGAVPDYYVDLAAYELWITGGTAGGKSYVNTLVGSWTLGVHKPEPTRVLVAGAGG